jgi:hypothetical protein
MNALLKSELPPARILDVTEEEYFADSASAVPSLSQSIAHLLVSESPRHAWAAHPKLGNMRAASTRALDEGTLIHKLMLGAGAEVVIVPFDDYRKKDAQAMRHEAVAAGKLPVIARKYDEMQETATRLRDRLKAEGFPLDGRSEVAIEWHERGEHGPVVCRGRMDHVFINEGRIYDIKKARSVNPRQISRNFNDYGYPLQTVAYTRALAALNPAVLGRIEFTFLFLELDPPYEVVPVRPDGAFREIGALKWHQAVHTWEECLATGHWPGYANGVVTITPPAYVIAEHLGTLES